MSEIIEHVGPIWAVFEPDEDAESFAPKDGVYLIRLVERCNLQLPEEYWFATGDESLSKEEAAEYVKRMEDSKRTNRFARKMKPGLVSLRITEETTDEQLEKMMEEAKAARDLRVKQNAPDLTQEVPEYPKFRIVEYTISITKKEA